MGRDCKYCGAYISDMVEVCPACGKRSKQEKASEAEHWTGSYTAGAASQSQYARGPEQAKSNEQRRDGTGSHNQAYTYKQEYERRYGSQQKGNSARRPGQQAPPRGSAQHRSYGAEQTKTRPRYAEQQCYATPEDDDVRRNRGISFLSYFGPLFLIPYFVRNDSEFARFHSNQGLLLLLANMVVNVCASAMPILGWLIRIIGSIFVLCGFVNGLVNVSKGLKKPLPIIGEINILK